MKLKQEGNWMNDLLKIWMKRSSKQESSILQGYHTQILENDKKHSQRTAEDISF